MKHFIEFDPGAGPSYFTLEEHRKRAMKEGVPTIQNAAKSGVLGRSLSDGIRSVLDLPSSYNIFFFNSLEEVVKSLSYNLSNEIGSCFVNGLHSQNIYEKVKAGISGTESIIIKEGLAFRPIEFINTSPNYIFLALTEPSTGLAVTMDELRDLKLRFPETLIILEATASLPFCEIDYSLTDIVIFSTQMGFGLPGQVWVMAAGDRYLDRMKKNNATHQSLGTGLPLSFENNILPFYLLDRICNDMLQRGREILKNETIYKSAILYQCLEAHPILKPFVKTNAYRSSTVITGSGTFPAHTLTYYLEQNGIHTGEWPEFNLLRFGNFASHSKEQYEKLVDLLVEFSV